MSLYALRIHRNNKSIITQDPHHTFLQPASCQGTVKAKSSLDMGATSPRFPTVTDVSLQGCEVTRVMTRVRGESHQNMGNSGLCMFVEPVFKIAKAKLTTQTHMEDLFGDDLSIVTEVNG
jgi:hypothetical protein